MNPLRDKAFITVMIKLIFVLNFEQTVRGGFVCSLISGMNGG